ncbi:hypothetical protein GCM10011369_23000 [Neiella marina]|uniref:DUF2333 family protein n=1 Tax=Neiella marina TaxID=508461 RepID=A0A8J2XPX0_9GAMM|nr:DUF2333 family protein [Neiella marina]GGA80479.1 hypothetical protein GCM10011369_23000 [Neiella marina]
MYKRYWKSAALLIGFLFVVFYFIAVWWSGEPDVPNVESVAKQQAQQDQVVMVPGYTSTTALVLLIEHLLDKPGGYLSNDVTPPGIFMDNMPNWEFGVLEIARDTALAMRRDFARSQSQSTEDSDLTAAHPALNISHTSWMFPAAEDEYDKARKSLLAYRSRLADPADFSAQFYTRADNLNEWLRFVEKRLGSVSQALSASVGRDRINIDMLSERYEDPSTAIAELQFNQTSWWKIDDVFYHARGTSWALLVMFKAVEVDFADVLEKKNATVGLQQIIRELEATQEALWSPMVLNGSGFGMLANHSLVMANYISRANAAVIDLRELLNQG